MPAFRRSSLPLLPLFVLALALAGCGDEGSPPVAPEPQPLPLPGVPPADSPASTMIRFEAAYEAEAWAEYLALFSADFSFRFSTQSDPDLVSQYGTSWGVARDSASTRHLFDGFTNDAGDFLPGASTISLSLPGAQIVTDPEHPDSSVHYRLVSVPALELDLGFGGDLQFLITAPHDFHLVRGDAAVRAPGEAADSTRWRIRRWSDRSLPLASRPPGPTAPARQLPASTTTWGAIKATYLE